MKNNMKDLHRLSIQHGLTLVELLISLTVGSFAVMAATALLISTKSGYIAQIDDTQLLDTGRHAIEIITRSARQASYNDWEAIAADIVNMQAIGPAVLGLDAKSLKSRTEGVDSPVAKSINGSDVLAIRFSGSGEGANGDGSALNCGGFGVGTIRNEPGDDGRGWSIFYVAEDATGEPELYCKYQGDDNWASQAIARGVESFQVLYALDTDADGMPNTFVNAAAIDALDNALPLAGNNARERLVDKQKRTHWKKVVAVRVALLVRGDHTVRDEGPEVTYDLFGKVYADANLARDPGVRIQVSELPKAVRKKGRRVFTATIQLRTRPMESPV